MDKKTALKLARAFDPEVAYCRVIRIKNIARWQRKLESPCRHTNAVLYRELPDDGTPGRMTLPQATLMENCETYFHRGRFPHVGDYAHSRPPAHQAAAETPAVWKKRIREALAFTWMALARNRDANENDRCWIEDELLYAAILEEYDDLCIRKSFDSNRQRCTIYIDGQQCDDETCPNREAITTLVVYPPLAA